MDVSYQEAKLFDVPADMKGVMAQKKDAPRPRGAKKTV